MTYRRLFLWLFTCSTLALAVLWWDSGRMGRRVVFSPKHFRSYTVGVAYGRVGLDVRPWSFPERLYFTAHRISEADAEAASLRPPPWGGFRIDRQRVAVGGYPAAVLHSYQAAVPLWFPWLLLNGTAFVLCRRMEKRTGAVVEKKLAEGDRADMLGGLPD